MSHDAQHPDPSVLPPADSGSPVAPPAIIFHGSVSLWMGFRTFALGFLLDFMGAAAAIYGALHVNGPLGHLPIIVGAALFIASGLMMLYAIMRIRTQRYKITERLIEREEGLIIKRVDSLDLGRVKDIELAQSVVDRILGIGTIEIFSSDQVAPVMFIEAIPNPRPVYEKLRDAIFAIAQRRGVIPMDR